MRPVEKWLWAQIGGRGCLRSAHRGLEGLRKRALGVLSLRMEEG